MAQQQQQPMQTMLLIPIASPKFMKNKYMEGKKVSSIYCGDVHFLNGYERPTNITYALKTLYTFTTSSCFEIICSCTFLFAFMFLSTALFITHFSYVLSWLIHIFTFYWWYFLPIFFFFKRSSHTSNFITILSAMFELRKKNVDKNYNNEYIVALHQCQQLQWILLRGVRMVFVKLFIKIMLKRRTLMSF